MFLFFLQIRNRQLMADNRMMGESVRGCDSMRQEFDNTDEELYELRLCLKDYEVETMRQKVQLQSRIEQLETANERLRAGAGREHRESVDAAAVTEPSTELLDTIIRRYRTVVGEQAARIVEMRDAGGCGAKSIQ